MKAVEKIGRAGGVFKRKKQQLEWDNTYGKGNWQVGYVWKGETYTREEALEKFYNASYLNYMRNNPHLVKEVCQSAKELFNAHAIFTTGVDLQVPAVLQALEALGEKLKGHKMISIGSYQVKRWTPEIEVLAKQFDLEVIITATGKKIKYPNISYELSPYKVPFWKGISTSLENFWQNNKYLLVQ